MGLIPTKKQQDQMWMLVGILVLLTMTGLAMYGAWKYPVPYHYYENMNYAGNDYSNFAFVDDIICECGNDPTCEYLEILIPSYNDIGREGFSFLFIRTTLFSNSLLFSAFIASSDSMS